jgi:hypothetical protein
MMSSNMNWKVEFFHSIAPLLTMQHYFWQSDVAVAEWANPATQ